MATKIRLQRHGKKGKPFFHIVTADTRAKRDGRFIEKLGTYNPNTNPATINLEFDRALYWVSEGAEMTDTARAILSYKGVLFKNHLVRGIAKGALTEKDVEKKFDKWLKEKEAKIAKATDAISKESEKEKAARLKAEAEVSAKRAEEIVAKNTPEAEPAEDAPAIEGAPEVETTAEAEAPAEEAKVEEEAPSKDEKPSVSDEAEPAEEVKAEAKEEAKEEKTEDKKEEPKAEDKAEEDKKEEKAE